jgi:hypothetical protein
MQTFPLLAVGLILFVLLNLFVSDPGAPWYALRCFDIEMISQDVWKISAGDAFIMLSLALLFVEILRSTKSGSASVMNHALSVLVFLVAAFMFIAVRGYGNSVFFVFTAMTFLDFMAGFIITTVTSRRDFSFRGSEA